MRVLVLVILGAAGAAAAEPLDLRENTLREPEVSVEAADLRLIWRLDGVLASRGAGTRAARAAEHTASASAEVAVAGGDGCHFAAAGGQVDARSGDAAPFAFQQWASLCPLSGVVRFQLDHRLVWDVTPRLLAPPRLRPSGNRRETIGIELAGFGEEPRDPRSPVPRPRTYAHLAPTRIELGFGWAADAPPDVIPDLGVAARLAFFHVVRERLDGSPPFELRVIDVAADVVDPPVADAMTRIDPSMVMAMRFDVARVDGLRVGGGVRFGGSLGFGDLSVLYTRGGVAASRSATVGRASVSLERDVGPLVARLAAGRDLWPTWDGRGVIDDRVTAGVAGGDGALRGRAELSAARVGLLAAESGLAFRGAGGLTLAAERDLGRHLTARAHLEVGRSVYAHGASFEAPRWAAEGLASLQLHAGNR